MAASAWQLYNEAKKYIGNGTITLGAGASGTGGIGSNGTDANGNGSTGTTGGAGTLASSVYDFISGLTSTYASWIKDLAILKVYLS